MHELTIATWLVEAVEAEVRRWQPARAVRVQCRVGSLRSLDAALLAEAFALSSKGSVCDGARLEIEPVGVELRCSACGLLATFPAITFECPACGSTQIELSGGDALELVRIELETSHGDRSDPTEPARGERQGRERESLSVG